MSLLSVIIPIYNERENILPLYEQLSLVAQGCRDTDFEFLFVDDGSTDNSAQIITRLRQNDRRIKLVQLSRNFGSHSACRAGLERAGGDLLMFLSADMQDPPDVIPRLIAREREGFDIVLAVRSQRADDWPTAAFANLYHRLMRRYALRGWPPGGTDVLLFTRQVRDVVAGWKARNTSLFAQIIWCGFRQATIRYSRQERRRGTSKWSFQQKVKLLMDSFASFSMAPLRFFSYLGLVLMAGGLGSSVILVVRKVAMGLSNPVWAFWLVALSLFSAFQLLAVGLLGEYLWRVAEEVRGGPAYVIRKCIGVEDRLTREGFEEGENAPAWQEHKIARLERE